MPFSLSSFLFSLAFLLGYLPLAIAPAPSQVLRVGALLDSDSDLGQRCLHALQLAVQSVNAHPLLLQGFSLELVPANSYCNAVAGASSATWLLGSWGVVAMCGPQSSSVAHFVSHLAARTQVPLVSFGATNPTLSEQQYPYFTRLVWSDLLQMSAIAALIKYYAWREIMVLYIEDNYGKNGADVLEDLIDQIGSRIVFKAGFDPAAGNDTIATVLSQLKLLESRVYVVHMHQAMARTVFLVANYLKMMSPGYVWIVTDSVASSLDSTHLDLEFVRATQGVIGTRMYIPKTVQLLAYLMQRNNATGRTDLHYYSYELLAYESLWMIAYALDRFLQQGNSFEFVASDFPSDMPGGNSDLAQLKVLANGDVLLQHIRNTSFIGITGLVKLDERGDAKGISFEIVNRVGTGLNVVGYWVNGSGCSSTPPPFQIDGLVHEVVTGSGNTEASGKLQEVTWPGGVSTVPRGWVVPKNGMPLTIGVPIKIGYPEFVSAKTDSAGVTTYHGFCIDVFETAITYLPYAVSYKFVPFGNGSVMPNYGELIEKIVTKEYDAVVGDVAITTARSKLVDFTQPYTTSGLMVVVPMRGEPQGYAWAFLSPFTAAMWLVTCIFFLLTGLVIWILEHKKNKDFRGRPRKQFVTTLWFIFCTLFFSQREKVKSTLGRAVLIIWLFVVLIITSSYTASLTSILTVEKLSPAFHSFAGLVESNDPIGFQGGSFVEDYLLQLNIAKERLVPLGPLSSYATALRKGPRNGGVTAIVDEFPYLQLFLATECGFAMVGQESTTKGGWGFAFPKGSQLAIDMSSAILELSENGQLQQIHDLWLSGYGCSSEVQVQFNQLNLSSFWGLFLITGVTSFFCIICYYIRMIWQYNKLSMVHEPDVVRPRDGKAALLRSSRFRRGASFLKSLAAFIEAAEIDDRSCKKDSNKDRSPEGSATRMSSSERAMGISTRDSVASAEDTQSELRELIRELSLQFKRKDSDGMITIKESEHEERDSLSSGRQGNGDPSSTERRSGTMYHEAADFKPFEEDRASSSNPSEKVAKLESSTSNLCYTFQTSELISSNQWNGEEEVSSST